VSQLATRGLEALLAHDVELTGDGGDKVPALARTQPRHEHPDQLGSPRRRRVPGVSLARSPRQPHLGVVKGVGVNSWGPGLLVS
jgi:hypothetical protein